MTAVNVYNTSASGDNISRKDALVWVNDTLLCNYNKVEELCSGNDCLFYKFSINSLVF